MSADTVVNMAKLAWEVIKDGAAHADISNSTANAVPQVDNWQSLNNAKGPMWLRRRKQISYLWPLDDYLHVDVEILLKWDYGATYMGGGAFIPNVYVEVPTCFVGWPWDVNISLTTRNPTNAASEGEPPIARLPVTLSGTVTSGAELYRVDWGFVLFGTGDWE